MCTSCMLFDGISNSGAVYKAMGEDGCCMANVDIRG